ncbi:hypothetical protein C5N14_23160 [Micromonospora sp. MW-13]|uniref:hypothetical protein n=1 Tax=Micromonospora sp. MW-13 TaxID=2094022 RepID=UPI000E45047D|nr:hypothetical protein [Micromonospora sp. MW-13]RGC66663.1 hypothetical protein C5N14_23160 [Micromonospora sp. MW-13]
MAFLGSRARHAALALLAGTALAGLLGTTAAPAAPPAAQPDRVMTVTDVWMRDVATDVGLQPHTGSPIWSSPDVKVCPTAVACATSQFPVVGMTSYIFVTLRNPGPYGAGTDSGSLRIYRTSPGGGMVWPTDLTWVATVNVVVPAGATTVVVPWGAVPGPGHFSLLAVWDSPDDPLPLLTPDLMTNVRNNNNIAWRDLLSV